MLRNVVAIGLIALTASACSVSRSASVKAEVRGLKAVSQSEELRTTELRSTESRDSVVVELRDTLVETTTITIDRNEVGDTIRMTTETDRERVRDRSQLRDKSEKKIVRVDTVYVAVRDSTDVRSYGATESQSGGTTLHRTLKWVLAIAFLLLASVVFVRARH